MFINATSTPVILNWIGGDGFESTSTLSSGGGPITIFGHYVAGGTNRVVFGLDTNDKATRDRGLNSFGQGCSLNPPKYFAINTTYDQTITIVGYQKAGSGDQGTPTASADSIEVICSIPTTGHLY